MMRSLKNGGIVGLALLGLVVWAVWKYVLPKSGSSTTAGGLPAGEGSPVQVYATTGGDAPLQTLNVDPVALEAYKAKKATREQILSLGKPFIYEALGHIYGPMYKPGLSATNNPGPYSKSDADFFLAAKTAAQADSGWPVSPFGALGPFSKTQAKWGYALAQMTKYGRPRILSVEGT